MTKFINWRKPNYNRTPAETPITVYALRSGSIYQIRLADRKLGKTAIIEMNELEFRALRAEFNAIYLRTLPEIPEWSLKNWTGELVARVEQLIHDHLSRPDEPPKTALRPAQADLLDLQAFIQSRPQEPLPKPKADGDIRTPYTLDPAILTEQADLVLMNRVDAAYNHQDTRIEITLAALGLDAFPAMIYLGNNDTEDAYRKTCTWHDGYLGSPAAVDYKNPAGATIRLY